ncbi:MAG: hypothetical protein FWB97_05040 [Oscillospiraceae bacterium]|nr:hypothetical protein [Oscillospiraceae bacterium]
MALGKKYTNSVDNPMGGGKIEGVFTFDVTGDTFTGTATATGMGDAPITEGKISGDQITFVIKASSPMGDMTSKIQATVHADKISGTMDMGMGPPMPFEATLAE